MLRFAAQSLQSFPLDTFPLPRTSNSAGFGQHTRKIRRIKSGGAGFGQHTQKSRRGKSGGTGFGQHTRKSRQSRRPPFPKMANIPELTGTNLKSRNLLGFDFLNSFLPFFAGTKPPHPQSHLRRRAGRGLRFAMTPSPRARVLGQLQGIKGVFVKIASLRCSIFTKLPP